jgi:ABC-type polysaccharide/polyol phosphate transport system ATPase subunit
MKTFHVNLGRGLSVDVLKLVESRVGICANSGAGKSYLMRLIAEAINIDEASSTWRGALAKLR